MAEKHLVPMSGLTAGRYHLLNGKGMAKAVNVEVGEGGALLPISAPSCPTALWSLVTAACDVSWPFPQLVVGSKVMFLLGNSGGVGKVWKVTYTAGVWALVALTITDRLAGGSTRSSVTAFTKLWQRADVGNGVVLSDGDDTMIYSYDSDTLTYLDSAAGEVHICIGALEEYQGHLFLGGFEQLNDWDAAWRARISPATDITKAGEDFGKKTVWRSPAGDYDLWHFLTPGFTPSYTSVGSELVANGSFAVTQHVLQPEFTITEFDDFLPSGVGWSWSWDCYPLDGPPYDSVIAAGTALAITQDIIPAQQAAMYDNKRYIVTVQTVDRTQGTLHVWLDDDSTRGYGREHMEITSSLTKVLNLLNRSSETFGAGVSVIELRPRQPGGSEDVFMGRVTKAMIQSFASWDLADDWYLIEKDEVEYAGWYGPANAAVAEQMVQTISGLAAGTYRVTIELAGRVDVTLGNATAVPFWGCTEAELLAGINVNTHAIETVAHDITITSGTTISLLAYDTGIIKSVSVKLVTTNTTQTSTDNLLYNAVEGECWMDLFDSGDILRYKKIQNCLVAYCENGVFALFNDVQTGAFGSRRICDVGLLDVNLVAGTEYEHRFVDSNGHLRMVTLEDVAMYRQCADLGYSLYMPDLEANQPILSHDARSSEWWVGYVKASVPKGFLTAQGGVSELLFAPSAVHRLFGERVSLVAAPSGTGTFELETEQFNMNEAKLKRITRARVIGEGLSGLTITVTGETLGTTDYDLAVITSDYLDSIIVVTGHMFRVNVTGAINATGRIYAIELEWEPAE